MPRITKEEKARNRQNIVEAAGRMFRAQGIDAVGIADLMKEAGLTHGGFYNHFASKDDLAAEVCNASFAASLGVLRQAVDEGTPPSAPRCGAWWTTTSPPATATPRTAAAPPRPSSSTPGGTPRRSRGRTRPEWRGTSPASRGSSPARGRGGRGRWGRLPEEARERAVLLLSRMVGAMVLARAVRHVEPGLSDEILRTSRAHALD